MSDEFVRKDIYDIETRRIYGRIDDAVLRMEARNEASNARSEAAIARMQTLFLVISAVSIAIQIWK